MSNAMKTLFSFLTHLVSTSGDIIVRATNKGGARILIPPTEVEAEVLAKDGFRHDFVLVPTDAVDAFINNGDRKLYDNRELVISHTKGVVHVEVRPTLHEKVKRTCTMQDLKIALDDVRILDAVRKTDELLCTDDADGSFESDLKLLIKRHQDQRDARAPKDAAASASSETDSPKEAAPAAKTVQPTAKPAPKPAPKPAQKPAPTPRPPVAKLGGATMAEKLKGIVIAPDGRVVVKKDEVKTPSTKMVVPTAPAVPAPTPVAASPASAPVEPVAPVTDDGPGTSLASDVPSLDELVNATLGQTGPDPLFGDMPGAQPVAATSPAAKAPGDEPATDAPAAEPTPAAATASSATPATAASPNTGGSKKPGAKKGPRGGKGKTVSDTEAELTAAARAGR